MTESTIQSLEQIDTKVANLEGTPSENEEQEERVRSLRAIVNALALLVVIMAEFPEAMESNQQLELWLRRADPVIGNLQEVPPELFFEGRQDLLLALYQLSHNVRMISQNQERPPGIRKAAADLLIRLQAVQPGV